MGAWSRRNGARWVQNSAFNSKALLSSVLSGSCLVWQSINKPQEVRGSRCSKTGLDRTNGFDERCYCCGNEKIRDLELNIWHSEFLVAGCQQNFTQVRATEWLRHDVKSCHSVEAFASSHCEAMLFPPFLGCSVMILSVSWENCAFCCVWHRFLVVFLGGFFCFLYNHAVLVHS